jgi:hypothetical protein
MTTNFGSETLSSNVIARFPHPRSRNASRFLLEPRLRLQKLGIINYSSKYFNIPSFDIVLGGASGCQLLFGLERVPKQTRFALRGRKSGWVAIFEGFWVAVVSSIPGHFLCQFYSLFAKPETNSPKAYRGHTEKLADNQQFGR